MTPIWPMDKLQITRKKRAVDATIWRCQNSNRVLIIAPAMGVRRSFYSPIAEYFHKLSYSVLTLDYYGMLHVGKQKNSRTSKLTDWGHKDIDMIIDYASRNFPKQDLFFLGHSIAGQVFPLAKRSYKVKAAFLVASQNASISLWSGKPKIKVGFFWHIILPLAVFALGYLPGWAYGGKHPLQKSIAKEWSKWGKNRFGLLGVDSEAKKKYKNLNLPTKFLSFSDDQLIAPRKAADELCKSYGSPYKYHEHILPEQVGLKSIGHFKFFTHECSFLWDKVDRWFTLIMNFK